MLLRNTCIFLCSSILVLTGLVGCSRQAPVSSASQQQPQIEDASSGNSAEGEAAQRKERNMMIIAERGIHVMDGLPVIETEEEAAIQPPEAVARRAIALMVVALYSESMLNPEIGETAEEARAFIDPIIEQYGIADAFSEAEKAYLANSDPTESEMINYAWQYENLGVMLWALGLMEELPFPDSIVDVALTVQRVKQFDTIEDMVSGSTPKRPSEILDAADLIYRLDWACVEARINEEQAPGGLDSGVVMERHKSLNWLIRQGEDWDKIDIST